MVRSIAAASSSRARSCLLASSTRASVKHASNSRCTSSAASSCDALISSTPSPRRFRRLTFSAHAVGCLRSRRARASLSHPLSIEKEDEDSGSVDASAERLRGARAATDAAAAPLPVATAAHERVEGAGAGASTSSLGLGFGSDAYFGETRAEAPPREGDVTGVTGSGSRETAFFSASFSPFSVETEISFDSPARAANAAAHPGAMANVTSWVVSSAFASFSVVGAVGGFSFFFLALRFSADFPGGGLVVSGSSSSSAAAAAAAAASASRIAARNAAAGSGCPSRSATAAGSKPLFSLAKGFAPASSNAATQPTEAHAA